MSSDTLDLKLCIDKTRGIVLVAEADEKFIDALTDEVQDTSFLFDVVRQTAPPGSSVVNLCNSYDALYETSSDSSDSDSDEVYCCRICFQYHATEKLPCPECRKDMSLVSNSVQPPPITPLEIYMITDDLKFKPMTAISLMNMLKNHMLTRVAVDGLNALDLEERVVKLSLDEVAKLVRTASHSKKVLTDFFLNNANAESEDEDEDEDEFEDESESESEDEDEDEDDSVKREEFVVVLQE